MQDADLEARCVYLMGDRSRLLLVASISRWLWGSWERVSVMVRENMYRGNMTRLSSRRIDGILL
jgi:hypothetical protein